MENKEKQQKEEKEICGACLVTDPQTGTSKCVYVTKDECKKLKGTYIGGPCGGF